MAAGRPAESAKSPAFVPVVPGAASGGRDGHPVALRRGSGAIGSRRWWSVSA